MRIPIHVCDPAGCGAGATTVRIGVPLGRGAAASCERLAAIDADGRRLPWQGRVLARWPDRSIKWMLVDVLVPCRGDGDGDRTIHLVAREQAADVGELPFEPLAAAQTTRGIAVRGGRAEFELRSNAASLLASARIDGVESLGGDGVAIALADRHGVPCIAKVSRLAIEHAGPVRVDVVADGRFGGAPDCPLEFRARLSFFAAAAGVACDLRIRNPRPARHLRGLWDLGDDGSWLIGDLSLRVSPAQPVERLVWFAEPGGQAQRSSPVPWCLYQDSSGGECWDSPNHVDANGRSTVRFRGYEVRAGDASQQAVLARGDRAQPRLVAAGQAGWIAVAAAQFWQNFPKALRWRDEALEIGLFPRESAAPVELQGGEQKRHELWLDFGAGPCAPAAASPLQPLHAWIDPSSVAASGAVAGFTVDLAPAAEAAARVARIVEGPSRFAARRELIDEYGWRNFGDLYADHEAVRHREPAPFISHYNNQYDFAWGAGVHALRTGDPRWWALMREVARHTVDIDVYHTRDDRPAFNGGLFWHSDHYLPAATATHRTYSRVNAAGDDYGGGPGSEHDYASGLALYHYLSGDADAREAVIGLADWVIAMDDGARTMWCLLDPGPTGAASMTLEPDYHGPGRGPGNSIGTLLDAYALTRGRDYMTKAEELIRRCIHPDDDIAARQLDQPERRWSYLAFLQALGRYLDVKRELGEIDFCFHYARESLLHYADWMLDNEVPYRDVLHRVELPTETWSAHDIRKCHVMHLAARYDDRGRAPAFRARAQFFYERCLGDLAAFPTCDLTRPLVILSVYGHLHAYHRALEATDAPPPGGWAHDHDFGAPRDFAPQRARAIGVFRTRLGVAVREALRLLDDRLGRPRRRREART